MEHPVGILINDYDEEFREYRLGFPNEEVERGFEEMRHRIETSTSRYSTIFDSTLFDIFKATYNNEENG